VRWTYRHEGLSEGKYGLVREGRDLYWGRRGGGGEMKIKWAKFVIGRPVRGNGVSYGARCFSAVRGLLLHGACRRRYLFQVSRPRAVARVH